ncbi:sensor histidine kinase [Sandaracinus amylolyticus]|uniref:sensor histidine kinase n=1 Tax=Sandaracinus amylolyticus TaxID=927083 RepID=UPI001F1CD6C8|nr:sensor histidine kinase KdpD [Sandaracinus amylolyticus]UJR82904.1 Hypothetical protein I5071_49690 [Sandaracinus amylolyticus]
MSSRDDEKRPDPDALLERVQAEEREVTRAKLRVWLGASPGVGKTFSMLESAQALRREGVDVVVGVVETHGRAETGALLANLEQLPRKRVPYRGRTLEELDLDAALARKPRIVLLDELAHTNVTGSRHAKRWQDAIELLDAGIDVHTTVNVQHVESLNDVIAQITHVRVRETVPDVVIERADEIELVDVPPEVVLARLAEGKVYVPEQAQRAAASFFKEGNLHALRELALRVTAERVDADVQAWRRQHGIETTWPTRERILVCVGPSPASAKLVRSARRMASAIRAPWLAVYVEKPSGTTMPDDDRARLQSHLRLAESLGGEVVVLSAERPAPAILELARRRNVTRIVAGKPTHPRWRDLVYGSMLDEIVRGSGDIDVHVITGDRRPTSSPPPKHDRPRPPSPLTWARGALPILAAAGIATLVRERVDLADVAMLFLVAIAVTAAFLGRAASLVASIVAVAVFDFFFVPPFFTFAVTDFRHVLTFAVMLCAGVVISGLTERIRQQSSAARERERRTAALYALTKSLATARDVRAVAAAAADQMREVFESEAALLVAEPSGQLLAPAPSPVDLAESERTVARWALEHGRPAGRGMDTLPGARVLAMPLLAEGRAVGVLAIRPSPEDRFEDSSQRHLLQAFVSQIALALERAQLEDEARRAELRAQTETMRSALLSTVSHDLRTPIAAILGGSTALLDTSLKIAPEERTALLAQIRDEAARLGRLVSNLLTMTRVESGALDLRSEWVPLEEIIGAALSRVERRLEGRELAIDVDPEAMARIDSVLVEQVVINLLDNVANHTPPGTPVSIRVARRPGAVVMEIADHGPGLPPGSEARMFEMFVRGTPGRGGGVGLGLAICRGIVQAHGGTITAENRPGGGALFRVTLPVEGEPPRVIDEDVERVESAP